MSHTVCKCQLAHRLDSNWKRSLAKIINEAADARSVPLESCSVPDMDKRVARSEVDLLLAGADL